MTRDDWERQLGADPSDTVTRLVYADWLEDNGEPVAAACQRWMVREMKCPYYNHYEEYPTTFDWWMQSSHDGKGEGLPNSCFLPDILLANMQPTVLERGYIPERWREYSSCRDAVAALQEALLALGWIGEEVRQ